MLYLSRTCYNGLYRENDDGWFTVPVGRYANLDWVMADRVCAVSYVLADASVRTEGLSDVTAAVERLDERWSTSD